MIRNITLSADEQLIARARQQAFNRGTTLNEEFRQWLASFADQESSGDDYHHLMKRLSYASPGTDTKAESASGVEG